MDVVVFTCSAVAAGIMLSRRAKSEVQGADRVSAFTVQSSSILTVLKVLYVDASHSHCCQTCPARCQAASTSTSSHTDGEQSGIEQTLFRLLLLTFFLPRSPLMYSSFLCTSTGTIYIYML